jgi:hypothetical protein
MTHLLPVLKYWNCCLASLAASQHWLLPVSMSQAAKLQTHINSFELTVKSLAIMYIPQEHQSNLKTMYYGRIISFSPWCCVPWWQTLSLQFICQDEYVSARPEVENDHEHCGDYLMCEFLNDGSNLWYLLGEARKEESCKDWFQYAFSFHLYFLILYHR